MKIQSCLAEEIANILGLPVDSVIGSYFDDLGLTSVNMTEIVEKLSLTFPQLPITILYEYKNLEALSHFLQTNYAEIVAEKFAEIAPHLNINEPALNQPKATDIAIIGMAGYFPGATNLDAFWELLLTGQSAISEIPIERWNKDEFYSSDEMKSGHSYSKWGAFLTDIDQFDPLLFNISPRDAAKIDPQERLFLQASYTALEDSGYISLLDETKPSRVGVFVGVTNASYGWLENDHEQWRKIKHVNVSSAYWSVANRISYIFNFSGPSLSIDTACSSSLTALHLACESLKRGECTYSIVGGVNLILHPRQYTELSEMKMLSRGSQNKTFSDAADGFVYGEGIIALVLKPLQQAIDEQDRIYAVIKSTSINANGKTSGYTVPSPNAQASLISDAITNSGFKASDIQYVECHGTGTKLGDPIEIRGLTKAFEYTSDKKQYCLLGSVKTNIGHLESAAGLAGVVKAALQITNKCITPSILIEPLNKKIDFENSPFKLAKEPQPWPNDKTDLVSCVSSFGAGGANAHAILSNSPIHPNVARQAKAETIYLLGISANHLTTLRQKLEEMVAWLKSKTKDLDLGNMVYTLNNHRLHYSLRMVFIFSDKETLEKQLLDVIVNEIPLNYYSNAIIEHKFEQELSQKELNQLIDDNPNDEKLHHLAKAYVKGLSIDWKKLYKLGSYQAIKVPTYPFLKERCWISNEFLNNIEQPIDRSHSFISEYSLKHKQCLKTFVGDHYAFAEHVLRGEKIFPGVCHLEMVYAAYTKLYQAEVGVISEITWLAPMNLRDDRCEAKLVFNDNGAMVSYQLGKLVNGEFLLCSQGKISAEKKEATPLDILSYKVKLTEKMDGDQLYAFFREKGWYHGSAFQSVNQLYFNDEILVAEIQLPRFFKSRNEVYGLNPGIMDGILQAITILNMRVSTNNSIALPFYLQSLALIKPLPEKVYALVTIVEAKGKNRSKFYDVAVTDLDGSTCLKLSGFTMAMIQEKSNSNDIQFYCYKPQQASIFDRQISELTDSLRILLVDKQNDYLVSINSSDVVINLETKMLSLDGHNQPFNLANQEDCLRLIQNLKKKGDHFHLVNLVDMAGGFYNSLSEFVHLYFGFIQSLLKERLTLKFIFSYEFSNDNQLGSLSACLPGFYKSLHAEIPTINACHLIYC